MKNTNLIYGVKDKPGFSKTLIFALQQVLAILAATVVVPVIINSNTAEAVMKGEATIVSQMSQSAALFGAGVGTIIYLLFTKFKSPVFLGSSFAFLGSMTAAFAGATTMAAGYLGLIIGAAMAGLVYVIISLIVKRAGTDWISKIMPAAVIGPTVAVIGLSLSSNAIGDLFKGGNLIKDVNRVVWLNPETKIHEVLEIPTMVPTASPYVALICGLVTLAVVIICSVYGKKMMKMIPFIIGIVAGYATACIFTLIGELTTSPELIVIDFSAFSTLGSSSAWVPEFTFIEAFTHPNGVGNIGSLIGTVAVAYIPVAFVVFTEHLADHKNISSIIGSDLTKDPGLHRTLLGDGVGSMVGAFFGGCPNTTYGESVGCVAISKNGSVVTILTAAIICVIAAFFAPFTIFLRTIPSCVMGGVCISLYGFIAVSGLKMIQKVDLNKEYNLFTVSVILIAGVGGMVLTFGKVTITSVACALILGIIVNLIGKKAAKKDALEDASLSEEKEDKVE